MTWGEGIAFTWGNSSSLRLQPGELIRVVEAYPAGDLRGPDGKLIGGSLPAAVALHPWVLDPELADPEWRAKYRSILREVAPHIEAVKAQGVEVIPVSGMLSWETRLFPNRPREKPVTPPVTADKASPQGEKGCYKLAADGRHGPAPLALPLERVQELMRQGLGWRSIAQVLSKELGREVSYQTVRRRIKEQAGGPE